MAFGKKKQSKIVPVTEDGEGIDHDNPLSLVRHEPANKLKKLAVTTALRMPHTMRVALFHAMMWPQVTYKRYVEAHLRPTRKYWSRLDQVVILGALPLARDVRSLHENQNVHGIINFCEEYQGPMKQYKKHGINQLRIPVLDYTSPMISQLEEGMQFLWDHAKRGQSVYVHCKAGKGRSATLAYCWLMETREMGMDETLKYMVHMRPHVSKKVAKRAVVKHFVQKRGLLPNKPSVAEAGGGEP